MIRSLLGKFHSLSRGCREIVRGKTTNRQLAAANGRASTEILESRCLLSSTWFVAPYGADANVGSINDPFRTIQAAANVAQPGDTVEIRAGVYDETVTPKNSGTSGNPIIYEAYNGESVTVSGASPLANWTLDSGDIYEAQLPTNLGEGNNQIFVDGQALNEARFPTSTDLSKPTLAYATSVSLGKHSATIYDSALDQPAGYWDGAIIHIAAGQAWTANTGSVTGSAPGQITFTFQQTNSFELPAKGNGFYLTGTFKAFTAPGQFYVDSSGKAYLWTPSSDNPNSDDVEVKQRQDAFNLNSVSNITVQNLNIVGSTIQTNGSSTSVVLNHLSVTYPSQFLIVPQGWEMPSNSGIMLNGADDLLENSEISDSPGDGVYVTGSGSRVTNNVIHDVDTGASDSAAVRVVASKVEVDHNTIYNTGRDGIKHLGTDNQILYNTLYDIGLQTTEAGAIYCVRNNGYGTVIAYNNISDMHSGGYGETALFLDDYSSDYTVHDNIVSNVDIALKLNYTSQNNNIYNNTLGGTEESIFSNYKGSWSGSKFTNNVFLKSAQLGSGASSSGNVTTTGISGKGAAGFSSGASGNVGSGASGGSIAPSSGGTPPVTATTTPTTPAASTAPTTPSTPPTSTTGQTPSSGTTPPAASTPAPAPVVSTTPVVTAQPAPAPAPTTMAELETAVQTDQAAVLSAKTERQTTLKQLGITLKADVAELAASRRQFSASHREAARATAQGQTQANLPELTAELALLQQQVKADQLTLKEYRDTDFTGIAAARKALVAAKRIMRAARRTAK